MPPDQAWGGAEDGGPLAPGAPPQGQVPPQSQFPAPRYPPQQAGPAPGYPSQPGAPPQAASPVGQWQCQLASQSVSNNAFENWTYQFLLAVYPNGQFEAQGSYVAMTAGFGVPFFAGGQWQAQQGGVVFQGREQRQDGMAQQFVLVFTNFQPRAMSHQFSSGNGNLFSYCQR